MAYNSKTFSEAWELPNVPEKCLGMVREMGGLGAIMASISGYDLNWQFRSP